MPKTLIGRSETLFITRRRYLCFLTLISQVCDGVFRKLDDAAGVIAVIDSG